MKPCAQMVKQSLAHKGCGVFILFTDGDEATCARRPSCKLLLRRTFQFHKTVDAAKAPPPSASSLPYV